MHYNAKILWIAMKSHLQFLAEGHVQLTHTSPDHWSGDHYITGLWHMINLPLTDLPVLLDGLKCFLLLQPSLLKDISLYLKKIQKCHDIVKKYKDGQ